MRSFPLPYIAGCSSLFVWLLSSAECREPVRTLLAFLIDKVIQPISA